MTKEREAFDPDRFMHGWGEWAKWSDAREMVQAAHDLGARNERQAASAGRAELVEALQQAVSVMKMQRDVIEKGQHTKAWSPVIAGCEAALAKAGA